MKEGVSLKVEMDGAGRAVVVMDVTLAAPGEPGGVATPVSVRMTPADAHALRRDLGTALAMAATDCVGDVVRGDSSGRRFVKGGTVVPLTQGA